MCYIVLSKFEVACFRPHQSQAAELEETPGMTPKSTRTCRMNQPIKTQRVLNILKYFGKYFEYKSLTVSLLIFHFGFNLLHWKTRTLHLNKTPSNLAESSTMSRKIHKYEAALKPLFYACFHHLAIKLGNRFEWLVCVSWSESRAKFHFLLQALQSLSHCRYGNDMSWVFLCSIELCK